MPVKMKYSNSQTDPETASQHSSKPYRPVQIKQKKEELRSVVAIFRHGDRTPKQKMKMVINDEKILAFFKGKLKNIKLKQPRELQKILQIA